MLMWQKRLVYDGTKGAPTAAASGIHGLNWVLCSKTSQPSHTDTRKHKDAPCMCRNTHAHTLTSTVGTRSVANKETRAGVHFI